MVKGILMKIGAIRHNLIHYRKLIVIWTVLILIFSFISLSEGSGNETEKTGSGNYTYSHEYVGTESESNVVTNENVQSEENTMDDLELKEDLGNSTDSQVTNDENLENESKEVIGNSIDNQETDVDNLKRITNELNSTDNQESHEKIQNTGADSEEGTDNQESADEELKTETSMEKGTEGQASLEESTGIESETEQDTGNKEYPEKNQGTGKVVNCSEDNPESACKTQPQNEKTEENPCSESEMETGLCNGSKNVEIVEVETELEREVCNGITNSMSGELEPETNTETCSGENNPKNDDLEAQTNIEETNWSNISESKDLGSEIYSGKSSWNNLQFILSYPSTLRSFYTTHESVKITYKGSEALKDQKVDIYLVKTRSSSLSKETVENIMDSSTISFEDICKNPEFYIQVPETLSEDGDLSPVTLGPLPEGSYWVVVTLAENETKSSEPEKTILLEHYFKVLEYEMEAEAPNTLEEGENLEVNLRMKNAPSQKNYTYCAVLMREDACRTNMNVSSNVSSTKSMSGTFVQGLSLIEYFGFNSTDYGSETGKEKLDEKIQTFIGEGNGTVCIGEENQNTLSLKTFDLPPGNYLLLAGAYEKDRGLTGIAQKEVSIREVSTVSQNHPSLKTEPSVLDKVSSLGLEGLDPQIREEALQAVEVVKEPSKLASFLVTFVGTLLIGFTIKKRRR